MAAASHRAQAATYLVHDAYDVDTRDAEDHTFCGIMFDVHCKSTLPVDELVVSSVWVRGDLGPMQVFCTGGGYSGKLEVPSAWSCHFQAELPASTHELQELSLDPPLRLKPGASVGIYVHSSSEGEGGAPESVVYNNQRFNVTHDDPFIRLLPGMAHTGSEPFSRSGFWGQAWRSHREFVGRLSYGVKWLLWNPEIHSQFPASFRENVRLLLLIHQRPESSFSTLPFEAVLHLLNMCRWDWFQEGAGSPFEETEVLVPVREFRDPYGSLVGMPDVEDADFDTDADSDEG
ncbi:unnamed protein product [Polarella glacialis]|nr:unnamed protein product [Polarella glacialis]